MSVELADTTVAPTARLHPFEFLGDGQPIQGGPELAALARRAEASGYHGLVLPDHLLAQLGPLTAMSWIAAATDRLRAGTFVFNNDLRHPLVLAQELASLDLPSGGRVEVGIGAGWNGAEYEAIGQAFDRIPVRQARLAEGVKILKGAFGSEPFSFEGEFYRVTTYDGQPKPASRPHPRLLIAGGGRRTLELAAREADVVGLAPMPSRSGADAAAYTITGTATQLEWIRAAAGERFPDLVLNTYSAVRGKATVTDHALAEARGMADRISKGLGVEISPEAILESAHCFIGSASELEQKFLHLRADYGISSFYVGDVGPLDAVVERLSGR